MLQCRASISFPVKNTENCPGVSQDCLRSQRPAGIACPRCFRSLFARFLNRTLLGVSFPLPDCEPGAAISRVNAMLAVLHSNRIIILQNYSLVKGFSKVFCGFLPWLKLGENYAGKNQRTADITDRRQEFVQQQYLSERGK